MKLAQNNAKTQKKMNFNSQKNQLKFQLNTNLRKGDSRSCFYAINQEIPVVDPDTGTALPPNDPTYPVGEGTAAPSLEDCKKGPGTPGVKALNALYNSKGKRNPSCF